MKLNLITLLFFITGLPASAQVVTNLVPRPEFGNSIRFEVEPKAFVEQWLKDDPGFYFPNEKIENVLKVKGPGFNARIKSSIVLGVKLNPRLKNYNLAPVKYGAKYYPAFRISDGSASTVIALGITTANVANYRYRVIVNDSVELVPWSAVKLAQLYGEQKPYGFIGKFIYPGKQVLVEVININNYGNRDGVVFDCRESLKPYITNYLASSAPISPADAARGLRRNVDIDNDHDPVTDMVSNVKFKQGDIGKMQFFLKPHEGIPYRVVLQRKEEDDKWADVTTIAEDTEKDFFSYDFENTPAGKYALVVYALGSSKKRIAGKETSLDFTIKPLPVIERKVPVKQILLYVAGGLLVIGLLFWGYRRQVNIRLARSVQDKQNTNLKLRSIRSQLNPHFMFNALTSIQNLVNKNDMEGANHYLSRFADLTRKVLNTGEHDLISLEDEVKILDDYLQMEQLRFGFKYDIKVNDSLNIANTEVPAMLLQPFLENAIKHGVANLREKGIITVLISKDNNNLLFTITDNGPGFKTDSRAKSDSFGLKLSEERVQLLNEIYKDQPAILNIQSADTGTIVAVTLTNWIS